MRYFRCKCGKRVAWSSMGVNSCQGCPECNTTLEQSPEYHQTPTPHDWHTQYDTNTGSPYEVCIDCYQRKYYRGELISKFMRTATQYHKIEWDDNLKLLMVQVYENEPALPIAKLNFHYGKDALERLEDNVREAYPDKEKGPDESPDRFESI